MPSKILFAAVSSLALGSSVLAQDDAVPAAILQPLRGLGTEQYVQSIDLSPDGALLATGGGTREQGSLRIRRTSDGRIVHESKAHASHVHSVAFSRDGKWLVSGSRDRTVRVWDVTTGHLVRTLEGHQELVGAVAFSPDGAWIASADDASIVRLWDTKTWKTIQEVKCPFKLLFGISVSDDGSALAAFGGQNVAVVEMPAGNVKQAFETGIGFIESVAFSPDGKTLVAGGATAVGRWNIAHADFKRIPSEDYESCCNVRFVRKGELLLGAVGKQVIAWNTRDDSVREEFRLKDDLKCLTVARDEKTMVTATFRGELKLWRLGP